MDLELRDKVALLIGASRGIGGACALALAREGAKLVLVARETKALEERAALCRAAGSPAVLTIAADVTDATMLPAVAYAVEKKFGALDILITLVGGSQPGGTAELDDAQWDQAFARNLWPAVRASRLLLPLLEKGSARTMATRKAPSGEQQRLGATPGVASPPEVQRSVTGPVERGGSVIIHVASIWGREGGGPMSYNAAKAALVSLAHAQARELAPRGIRVLSVAPGSTLHPGGSWERRMQKDPQGTTEFVLREIPFGRFGTAEELGDVLAFLCSARASWVAGTCVVVDGAQSKSF